MISYYHTKNYNFSLFEDFMNTLIGYILLMTLMFSLAAGLYFGLKTIRLI